MTHPFARHFDERRWVEWRENSSGAKLPYTPGTQNIARINDSRTLGLFSDCKSQQIGIVLGEHLCGADFDAVRNPETGEIAEWAMLWIKRFNSYTEISPSGTGFKIFFYANNVTPIVKTRTMPGTPIIGLNGKPKNPCIEIYNGLRYFTITGQQFPGTPSVVKRCEEDWKELVTFVAGERARARYAVRKSEYAGRDDAIFKEGCRLRRMGRSPEDIEAVLRELNVQGSTLHENFITDGPLDERTFRKKLDQIMQFPPGDRGPNGELERMNSEFCALTKEGAKFRILSWERSEIDPNCKEYVLQTRKDFEDSMSNHSVPYIKPDGKVVSKPIGKWWIENPGRLTYKSLTFQPGGPPTIDERINIWRGWGIKPVSGDWSLMKQHILEVLADGDADHADYIIKWCAWAVQNPDKPGKVALVFKGDQQTGKGTLGRTMCKLFGVHGVAVEDPDHVTGRFNSILHQCVLLFSDEAFYSGDRAASRKLKAFITEKTISIERKGLPVIIVPNYLHIIMASNEHWVVPVDMDDWRFAVFRIYDGHAHDKEYFDPIYRQLESGGYSGMLYELLNMDLEEWQPNHDVPKTEEKEQQQAHSDEGVHWREYVEECIEGALNVAGLLVDTPVKIAATDARKLINQNAHYWANGKNLSRFGEIMKSLKFRFVSYRHAYLRGEATYDKPYVRLVSHYNDQSREWELEAMLENNVHSTRGEGPEY